MSTFDIAVCIDEVTLNKIAASLFGRQSLRGKLFSGSQSILIAGVNASVGWSIEAPPLVSLNPPTPAQWAASVKKDGTALQPAENAFLVHIPHIKVQKSASGGVTEADTSFDAICTASLVQNAITIVPLAVVIDLSQASKIDKVIYDKILIPRVLDMVGSMLSGRQLPNIDFQGATFGPFVIAVGGGLLAAAANASGKPAPQTPSIGSLPKGRFSVLMSPETMQTLANKGTSSLQGKSTGASGSQSFGIGKANYSANVRLNSVSASVSPSDLTSVNASIGVQVSAGAGIDVLSVITDAFSSY